MKRTKTIHAYLTATILITLCAVILRTIAYFASFDYETMHYSNKLLITIANILTACGVGLSFTYLLAEKDEIRLVPSGESALTYIPTGLVSIALMFCAADRISVISSGIYSRNSLLLYLSYALLALAVASVVGFFLMIFISKSTSKAKAAMLICITLYLAVYSVYLYFNKGDHPTNSPNKIVDQLAYLASAIYFLFEARIALGRAMWKLYIVAGLSAALLSAYSSLPALIMYLIRGERLSDSLYETALSLCVCIFVVFRIILTAKLREDVQSPAVDCICRLDEARRNDMIESKQDTRAREYNNMEENDSKDMENYQFDIPDISPDKGEDDN